MTLSIILETILDKYSSMYVYVMRTTTGGGGVIYVKCKLKQWRGASEIYSWKIGLPSIKDRHIEKAF